MKMLVAVVTIFLLIFPVTFSIILLYSTENSQAVDKFDCVYHVHDHGEEIQYCRRPSESLILNRNEIVCENQGQLFRFSYLIIANVLPSEVLSWNSGIEMADLYARFFYNRSSAVEDDDDQFLCRCTQPGTFGKYCEYQLTHDTESFSDAIKVQFEQKRNGDSWNTQRYGSILCYTTLMCDSGPLCLDWRDINDGMQRCVNGSDEENWDKLEFNECEDNEFRCTNGMCIPEDFWLDGHVDCMDWSDEIHHRSGETCPFTPNAMECDEHICPRNRYSCGDGQCIDWIARMAFQRLIPTGNDCFNKRNLNYMCEVSPYRPAWTLRNGLCWPDKDYDEPGYDINSSFLTNIEKCQYLFRCALSDGFEHDCPCNRLNCSQMMTDVCPPDSVLLYPPPGLIYPNVLFYYNYDQSESKPSVAGMMFYGSHRCPGYQLTLNISIKGDYTLRAIMYSRFNNILCTLSGQSLEYRDYWSTVQYDGFCYNNSITFNGRPYAVNLNACDGPEECISQYRIQDESWDCLSGADEYNEFDKNYCTGKVGQHRFQCFDDQHRCLPLSYLGTGTSECSNNYDEIWYDNTLFRRESIQYQQNNTVDCDRLKKYIGQSALKNASLLVDSQQQTSINHIPFRSYCDSFWDLYGHKDESLSSCQHWICQNHQYQCQSGQCIDLDWVCDGEWDCSDASDEEAIVLIDRWSYHNARLIDLNSLVQRCQKRYSRSPFSSICNTSSEFGCYRAGVSNPLDIDLNRPCINLTQIGDGVEDCYNLYDEKNLFEANSDIGGMLGFHLRCGNHYEPYSSACLPEAKNNCSKVLCSNHRSEDQSCSGINDAICLDGRCKTNGRCNGIFDCFHGEDEYWCPSNSFANQLPYRRSKKTAGRPGSLRLIPQFPPQNIRNTNQKPSFSKSTVHVWNDNSSIISSFICNRGVAVLQMDQIICLCPPAYYGSKCEFYSDRISIIVQVDPKTLPKSTLKIKAKLLFENKIIDDHEFTILPHMESLTKIKHKFYLLYSRSTQMIMHKQERYFNRTDVTHNHPYSVHFDVFSLEKHNSVKEFGSWHYPIYFDYLPAHRLSVILKFPTWFLNNTGDSCSQNVCNQNSICMPIFNQNNSYYCSCKSGYYGKYCEIYDSLCETYCSGNALCRNKGDDLRPHIDKPSCVCPLARVGPRCNVEHNDCDSNPCLNYGTCFLTNDPSGEASYMCLCSKLFRGNRCQYEMPSIHVDLNMTHTSSVRATVVQLYDFETSSSFQLLIRHQQVYYANPSKILYYHSDVQAPALGLLKVYENLTNPRYFIIYTFIQTSTINITSYPQHCPHVSSLFSKGIDGNEYVPTVFQYHHICRNNIELLCFYDENYLCLCQSDHYRAECFGHDTQLDHCNYCLSGGKCLQGNLKDPDDFICICPLSYYGRRCEFSTTTTSSSHISTLKAVQINYTSLISLFTIGFLHTLYLFTHI